MQRGKVVIMAGVLITLLVSGAAPVFAETAPSIQPAQFGWTLSNAKVINAGKTVTTAKGTLTTDYIVEAKAVGRATPIQSGTLRITVSAFSPASDMPGQKAGLWYVAGKWKMTGARATEKEKNARHSSMVINGRVSSVLTFNPAVMPGAMNASIIMPRSLEFGRWTEGRGTFSGNERWEGTLRLDAVLWPDVAKRAGVTK